MDIGKNFDTLKKTVLTVVEKHALLKEENKELKKQIKKLTAENEKLKEFNGLLLGG